MCLVRGEWEGSLWTGAGDGEEGQIYGNGETSRGEGVYVYVTMVWSNSTVVYL